MYILSNRKSVLHMTHSTAPLRSLQLKAVVNDSRTHQGEIRSALSSVRQKKRITIQNLLNEFKNSYFSTFAIQSLRLGLRRGGEKKNPFAFLLGARQCARGSR